MKGSATGVFSNAAQKRLIESMLKKAQQNGADLGDMLDRISDLNAEIESARNRWIIDTEFINYLERRYWDEIRIGTSLPTIANATGDADHPGILNFITTYHGQVAGWMTPANSFLIGGGEEASFIFKLTSSGSSGKCYFGLHDLRTAVGTPTDGCCFFLNQYKLYGYAYNNGVLTASSYYTITTDQWYKAVMSIGVNGSMATFKLYSYTPVGKLIEEWSEYITGGLPIDAGREVGFGAVVHAISGGGAAAMDIKFDYMALEIGRELGR